MPDDSDPTWPSLLANKRSSLSEICESAIAVINEQTFRTAFEALCDEHRQTRTQQHLANFVRTQLKLIKAFANGIDLAGRFAAATGLTSLVWGFAYAASATALEHERSLGLKNLTTLLTPLSTSVPNFGNGDHLTRHFTNTKVQEPLQQIFSEYFACYEMMISTPFATSPPPLSFDPIKTRFDTAIALFAARKREWDQALQEANEADEAEQEQRRMLASVQIVSNGLDGHGIGPQNTHVQFEFIRSLGKGTYGEVSEVRELSTEQRYARKSISSRGRLDSRSNLIIENQVKSEVAIMQKLRHPHIASVLLHVREQGVFSIIMLPVADYDLRHFLESEYAKDKGAVKQMDAWFGCLIVALVHAHNESVKHNDIKPSNILIKNGSPYLSDFGSAKDFSHLEMSTSRDDSIAGTPVYYAPERPPWGRRADVFALGCVFSEMLTVRCGRTLPEYRDFRQVMDIENGYAFRENLPKVKEWLRQLRSNFNEPLQLVYQQTLEMLQADPEERCEARTVKRRFRSEDDALFCHSCA